jgi:hypothetical protein
MMLIIVILWQLKYNQSYCVITFEFLKTIVFTRWFKYDWDDLCVNKSQFFPVIFEPPCICCDTVWSGRWIPDFRINVHTHIPDYMVS